MVADQNLASRPRVVIVGAGFGGLSAAKRLAQAPVDITIIDRQNHHLFQPLLYQVATASLSPSDIAVPVRSALRGQANAQIMLDEVIGVDVAARHVLLSDGKSIPYDMLVLATGSQDSYFGHDEWAAYTSGLKNLNDAIGIRRRLLLAFEHAEICDDEEERRRLMTFVLIGAGPTGVEMAGAVAELAHAALARDFHHIDTRSAHIILVEAGPRVLSSFPTKLGNFALRALQRMKVEVRLNTRIELIDDKGVVANGQRIAASTVIWCAGVSATPIARWLDIKPEHGGRVRVNDDLTLPGHADIFVIGDVALSGPGESGLPGVAPVAKQQGEYVGKLIAARAAGTALPAPFVYHNQGSLATIGRSAAVADFGWLRMQGWPAWLLWSLVHILFLIGFRNRTIVFMNWIWAFVTYGRGARLITGTTPPRA